VRKKLCEHIDIHLIFEDSKSEDELSLDEEIKYKEEYNFDKKIKPKIEIKEEVKV